MRVLLIALLAAISYAQTALSYGPSSQCGGFQHYCPITRSCISVFNFEDMCDFEEQSAFNMFQFGRPITPVSPFMPYQSSSPNSCINGNVWCPYIGMCMSQLLYAQMCRYGAAQSYKPHTITNSGSSPPAATSSTTSSGSNSVSGITQCGFGSKFCVPRMRCVDATYEDAFNVACGTSSTSDGGSVGSSSNSVQPNHFSSGTTIGSGTTSSSNSVSNYPVHHHCAPGLMWCANLNTCKSPLMVNFISLCTKSNSGATTSISGSAAATPSSPTNPKRPPIIYPSNNFRFPSSSSFTEAGKLSKLREKANRGSENRNG